MPTIDFYILSDEARFQFACQLAEKAYQQKNRLYIHVQNSSEAECLDQLLWTYRDDSFIPHGLYKADATFRPPVQIGFNVLPEDHRDILMNLSDDVPDFYLQFSRVLEIIPSDPAQQSLGRNRYRFYRDHHCELKTYKQ